MKIPKRIYIYEDDFRPDNLDNILYECSLYTTAEKCLNDLDEDQTCEEKCIAVYVLAGYHRIIAPAPSIGEFEQKKGKK